MGMDLLLAFFVALGIALLLWCLLGLLLVPVFGPDMVTLCCAKSDGVFLEHRVRSYGWLREGRLNGGRLIIVDCGLSEEGLELSRRLCGKYEWVTYYKGDLPPGIAGEMQDQSSNRI